MFCISTFYSRNVKFMCADLLRARGIPRLPKRNMKTVVSFGNPLLDTTVVIQDTSLLAKYNLKHDGNIQVSGDEMKQISKDISGFEQKHSAGGCAQNSLRVMQWLLHKQNRTIIFGSVGNDNQAVILKKLLRKDGVRSRFILQDSLPTGRTIALVKGSTIRSLVAHVAAAEKFSLDELLKIPDIHSLLKESNFVYVEGFFLTNRTETAKYILDFCIKHQKSVIFNICSSYICDMHPEEVKLFVENADIVFGNKHEFEALIRIMELQSIEELAEKVFYKYTKSYKSEYGKMVIITDGANPGTCIYEGKFEKFDIIPIKEKDILDTTSAGDAFLGGFMAGLCRDKTIKDCAKIGCYAAYHIIQQHGCTLPNFEPDIFNEPVPGGDLK